MTTTSKPRASMARTTTAGNSPSPATNPTRSGIVIGLLILGSIALPRAKPPTNAAFRPLDKRDQTPGLVAGQARVPHVVQRLRGVETGAIEQAIGAPQFPSHRGREAEATHPHDVEPPDAGGVALGDHKGWDVFHDARRTADHGQIPDADKLVYGVMAGDEGTILHLDIARQPRIVDHNNIIAQTAIVRHMCIGHEKIMRPNAGDPVLFGTAVDRHVLADAGMVADTQERALAAVFEILRRPPQDRADADVTVLADARPPLNHRMRADDRPCAEAHMLADHGVRADADPICQLSLGVDGSRGMDAHTCSMMIMACSSASAANLPFTVARPINDQTRSLRRRLTSNSRRN